MPNINLDDAYILGETGAQVDKVTGLFTKDEDTTSPEKAFAQLNIGTAGSNRNLLDNPWFTVRQRGDGPFTSARTTLDRWKIVNGCTVTGTANGMRFQSSQTYRSVRQILATPSDYANGTYTISVNLADATAPCYLIVYDDNNAELLRAAIAATTGIQSWTFTSNATGISTVIFDCLTKANVDITVKAVKLELGTVSTLANDAPPEYAEELMKCNFYDIMLKTSAAYGYLGYGVADSKTSATILIPLPNNMRDATPTITTSGTIAVKGGTSGTHTMTEITFKLRVTGGVLVTVTTTGLTTGEFCLLQLNNTSSYINLSADL